MSRHPSNAYVILNDMGDLDSSFPIIMTSKAVFITRYLNANDPLEERD